MGICTPPNEETRGARVESSSPLSRGKSATHPPNEHMTDERKNSFASLSGQGSPVKPPNAGHKWKMSDARRGTEGPAPVTEPGKGSVPVHPFGMDGKPMTTTAILRDAAKK